MESRHDNTLLHAGSISRSVWEDTWDEPSQQFEEWVNECALQSLEKYCGPSGRISPDEALRVFRKAVRVVIDNERKV